MAAQSLRWYEHSNPSASSGKPAAQSSTVAMTSQISSIQVATPV